MSVFTDILKGVAGVGMSVLGLVGGQPELVVGGVGLAGSILSGGTTTKVQQVAASTTTAYNAYNAAVASAKGQTTTISTGGSSFTLPSWLPWVAGGGLLLLLIKKR